jgi:integrase
MKVHLRKRELTNKGSGKPRHSLYLDIYYYKFKRIREFLGIYLDPNEDKTYKNEKLQLAENLKAKRQLELLNEEYGFPSKEKQKQNFVEYFEYQMNRRAGHTKVPWSNAYKYLHQFTKGSVLFYNIDKAWLEGFRTLLLNSLSPSSASLYYSKVKCALRESVKYRILVSNPADQVDPIKVPKKEKEFLTVDEIPKIANTPCRNDEVKNTFLFSCFTGLRYGDIMALKWSQIKKVNYDGNGTTYAVQLRQSKTGIINTIPLNETALNLIGDRREEDSLVFNLNIKHRSMQRILNQLLDTAKITKKITFHTARHSYAIMLLANGSDLMTVKELLGHKDIKSTQVYAKVIDPSKLKAINCASSAKSPGSCICSLTLNDL